MCVQSRPTSHPIFTTRKPPSADPESSPLSFVFHSPLWTRFGRNSKKAALGLVQSEPNSFIINRIIIKFASRKREKKSKTTSIRPLFSLFGPFQALCPFALLPPRRRAFHLLVFWARTPPRRKLNDLCSSLLAVPMSLGPLFHAKVPSDTSTSLGWLGPLFPAFRYGRYAYGMKGVWPRYEAARKSFAIKYGGMSYRGGGGTPKKRAQIAAAGAPRKSLGSASVPRLEASRCST